MGSNYFGEPNLGNERGSSSSRKGKKSNSEKPKQPQRGLGVAQLEKIRLHSQMGCTYLPSSVHTPYAPNFSQEDMRLPTGYSSSSTSFPYSSSVVSSSSYGFSGTQNFMMGLPDSERANIKYEDSQPSSASRRCSIGNPTFFAAKHGKALLQPGSRGIVQWEEERQGSFNGLK
ncbi:protein SPEAR3-like isoform X2 [Olea europaea var. sylvestris]|uniref:protein SPEAR3-like isoform X2 n=1 Tax=Olea europaea var. sylvestris TaxID=158386 RepID=UPI000C1D41EC|nr:protein SPEAR3-like isoform X2 [Olea europaea var. sylvestris]